LQSALSDKVLSESLVVLDNLDVNEYKTKVVADCLKAVNAGKKTLIVLSDMNSCAIKSAANIKGVKTAQVNTINTYDIINADTLVIVKDAVAKIEEVYA
jgi:large subunit ribosomal protein L4